MSTLKPNHVYIEVSYNQCGGLSLLICDDGGGHRLAGAKVGGCETLERFEINADELIEQINVHRGSQV